MVLATCMRLSLVACGQTEKASEANNFNSLKEDITTNKGDDTYLLHRPAITYI